MDTLPGFQFCAVSQLHTLILLSGGIDSTSCIAFYRQLGHKVSSVFIDYGQPASGSEQQSAAAVASYYEAALSVVHCSGPPVSFSGEILGRNAHLVFTALLFHPDHSGLIALGIHHGTRYYDCSEPFAIDLGRIVSGYTSGRVTLCTPFLCWTKPMIFEFGRTANVPFHLTWSCEVGPTQPCGRCLSCRDREELNARAAE